MYACYVFGSVLFLATVLSAVASTIVSIYSEISK